MAKGTKNIVFRCDPELASMIEQGRKESAVSVSEWLRRAALNEAERYGLLPKQRALCSHRSDRVKEGICYDCGKPLRRRCRV